MQLWAACPPLRVGDVRGLLPPELASLPAGTWICPIYRGLPMGSSHSVHILMTINLELTGRALLNRRLASTSPLGGGDHSEDMQWRAAHELIRHSDPSEGGLGLQAFEDELRGLRRHPTRVLVVVHLFCGPKRALDLEARVPIIFR